MAVLLVGFLLVWCEKSTPIRLGLTQVSISMYNLLLKWRVVHQRNATYHSINTELSVNEQAFGQGRQEN